MKNNLSYKFMVMAVLLAMLTLARTGRCLEGTEYQIKGAMMLNFIKFVEWPDSENELNRDYIVIGIIGRDNFGNMLEHIDGRFIGSKQIKIKRLNSIEKIAECQVLFVSKSESFRIYQILKEVNGYPVLTIGEDKDFTRLGGIIRFFTEENHIRFEINQTAAVKSNLKISAKLLEIARVIQ